jgi:hypothetical protein
VYNHIMKMRERIGLWLYRHEMHLEDQAVAEYEKSGKETKIWGLSVKESSYLMDTARARAKEHPEELKAWYTYSCFYLSVVWFKLYKVWKKVLS